MGLQGAQHLVVMVVLCAYPGAIPAQTLLHRWVGLNYARLPRAASPAGHAATPSPVVKMLKYFHSGW